MNVIELIKIDPYSATPKYTQLASSIITAVESGVLRKDDVLPSINELSASLEISRDTAEKGYRHLKKIGVLDSVPGKGFFIASKVQKKRHKILLLFNKLSAHKKILYDAFVAALDPESQIDFYIYNNDFNLFKKILLERLDQYSYYVLITHFLEGDPPVQELVEQIPKDKLIMLDKKMPFMEPDMGYSAVYERFEEDIRGALQAALPRIKNYRRLVLIFPDKSYYPQEIICGFKKFCEETGFEYDIFPNTKFVQIQTGDVYITVMEDDLVRLIEIAKDRQLVTGKDIGVISYNETPIKRIILSGITTISTDFIAMGKEAAALISEGKKALIPVPFKIHLRDSL
ncbi:GntR family transcriptional regulator [Arachidicoccus terrestris]|uniref:GntR family transcriptional regulator n=1 Tax=Arachidicoccus terrestris TaxID=2875539 RepID=UPI001CC7AFE8|nr:GntR family transcriptional regulator [Arachidicoccus terrestris]UAY56164.1 GntR family transcriptional regulator [Arachidicoccus terrestris]